MTDVSSKTKALLALLEDSDTVVRKEVDRYLKDNYKDLEEELFSLFDRETSPVKAGVIFDVIFRYNAEAVLADLSAHVLQGGDDYLYEWFLVNKLVFPSADYGTFSADVLALSGKIERAVGGKSGPTARTEAMNRVFYDELAFVPMTDENVPLGALLPSEVVVSNEGIPLVIDMLYVMLAWMQGFPVGVYLKDDGFCPCWCAEDGSPLFFMSLSEKGKIIPADEFPDADRPADAASIQSPAALLDIYVAVLSDIFRISGEKEKSELLLRAGKILLQ